MDDIQPLITRKTVASILGAEVSVDQVRKNERAWGLHRCRVDLNARSVRYREHEARACLARRFGR